jgi:hypothetical protein
MPGSCALEVMAHNYKTDPTINPATPQRNVCSNPPQSDPAHRFYYKGDPGELTTIFKAIGSALSTTRLVSNDAT